MQSIDNLSLLLGTEATLLKKKEKENIRSRVRRTRFEGFTKFTCSFLRLSTCKWIWSPTRHRYRWKATSNCTWQHKDQLRGTWSTFFSIWWSDHDSDRADIWDDEAENWGKLMKRIAIPSKATSTLTARRVVSRSSVEAYWSVTGAAINPPMMHRWCFIKASLLVYPESALSSVSVIHTSRVPNRPAPRPAQLPNKVFFVARRCVPTSQDISLPPSHLFRYQCSHHVVVSGSSRRCSTSELANSLPFGV